jgi:hypothetical protein
MAHVRIPLEGLGLTRFWRKWGASSFHRVVIVSPVPVHDASLLNLLFKERRRQKLVKNCKTLKYDDIALPNILPLKCVWSSFDVG